MRTHPLETVVLESFCRDTLRVLNTHMSEAKVRITRGSLQQLVDSLMVEFHETGGHTLYPWPWPWKHHPILMPCSEVTGFPKNESADGS